MTNQQSNSEQQRPAIALVIAAFAAIYLIWGSTYLAIRYAVESLPPFLMAGSRFFAAGAILFAFVIRSEAAWPTVRQWRDAFITGALLLLVGNGAVTWAEQTIPSSIAALMVAMVPLWIVLLEWRGGAGAPTAKVFAGLALGLAGVTLLVVHGRGYQGETLNLLGMGALAAATIAWAWGSLFSRRASRPKSPLLTVGMQMMAGGLLMLVTGAALGEVKQFHVFEVTASSAWAWLYLMSIGSLAGFTAYVWLLQICAPSKVATYAFVNPVIAVALGCTLGQEPFSPRLLYATGIIVTAVILIIRPGAPRSNPPQRAVPMPVPERTS